MKECHDYKRVGHPSMHHTLALVGDSYYWSDLKNDVKAYVNTFLMGQQDKIKQEASAGLIEPLPFTKRIWESVSKDLIMALPISEGCY